MSAEEKEAARAKSEARATAMQEAKAVCELLQTRKEVLSDNKNELVMARDARELSKTLKAMAVELKVVEANIPMLSALKVRDAVEATAVVDSKAHA